MRKRLIALLILLSMLCTSCGRVDEDITQVDMEETSNKEEIMQTSIDISNTTVQETIIEEVIANSNIERYPSDDSIKSVVSEYVQSIIDYDIEKIQSITYETIEMEDLEEYNPISLGNIITSTDYHSITSLMENPNDLLEHYSDFGLDFSIDELIELYFNALEVVSIGDYIEVKNIINDEIYQELCEEYPKEIVDSLIVCEFTINAIGEDTNVIKDYTLILCKDNSNWKVLNGGYMLQDMSIDETIFELLPLPEKVTDILNNYNKVDLTLGNCTDEIKSIINECVIDNVSKDVLEKLSIQFENLSYDEDLTRSNIELYQIFEDFPNCKVLKVDYTNSKSTYQSFYVIEDISTGQCYLYDYAYSEIYSINLNTDDFFEYCKSEIFN